MKIVVITRARNSEYHIRKFCAGYPWADKILVADGGSVDHTVTLARSYSNVKVRYFHKTIPLANGLDRNPDDEHLNFLVDWALEEQADWIVMDDVDGFPNKLVREHGRELIENHKHLFVALTRLYLWGDHQHFPRMAKPQGSYAPSLWAWRAERFLKFKANIPHCWFYLREDVDESGVAPPFHLTPENCDMLMPPYCLLHNWCPTEEIAQERVNYYRQSGLIPGMLHPKEIGGNLEELPDWAYA